MKYLLDFSPQLEDYFPCYIKEMKCKDSWVLYPTLTDLYFSLQNALELGGKHCSQVPQENALF